MRVRERGVGGERGERTTGRGEDKRAEERRTGGMRGMEEEKERREESGKISYHKDHHR